MQRILLLAGAVVFVDMLFFSALTPLLPHYTHTLGLGKTGAGALTAAYPLGVMVGAIPSGAVAARAGVKPTVVVGLSTVALCVVVFGLADHAWQLFAARFVQGTASAFSWTGGLAWLIAAAPVERRGTLIGSAFAAAVGGTLFGPVLGGVASFAGTGWTFTVVGVASLGLVAFAATTPAAPPDDPQPLSALFAAFRDRQLLVCFWLVLLPGLLFGNLSVLVPLRLSHLGYGGAAIGAVFLCTAALESGNNILVGRLSDRRGTTLPILAGLAGSAIFAAVLPWPNRALVLALVVVLASLAFGAFFTPALTLLTNVSEARGLDYGYAFALVNLAWAPGETLGAAGGGGLAHATADAVPYLALSVICIASFALLGRLTSRA
ncbi:MAG TPA: MFS transporter [Gaiellaceae bacterium]|nr:MFS transporter [Gaiellaceae bacterium]